MAGGPSVEKFNRRSVAWQPESVALQKERGRRHDRRPPCSFGQWPKDAYFLAASTAAFAWSVASLAAPAASAALSVAAAVSPAAAAAPASVAASLAVAAASAAPSAACIAPSAAPSVVASAAGVSVAALSAAFSPQAARPIEAARTSDRVIDFFIWEYPSRLTDRPAWNQIDPVELPIARRITRSGKGAQRSFFVFALLLSQFDAHRRAASNLPLALG
jgi:hypothetical protein